jgi:hypothetical protein
MADYKYDGLNKIIESLDATNVISDDYKRFIQGWAMHLASEAWGAGVAQAKEQVGKDTLAPVAASLESFLGESNRPSSPSDKALQAAREAFFANADDGVLSHECLQRAAAAAHDPALGLDRSVCLRDVVEKLRADRIG